MISLKQNRVTVLFSLEMFSSKLQQGRHSFPPEFQQLTVLRFIADGHFQVADGDLLQCSRFVSKIPRMITGAEYGSAPHSH